MLCWGDAVSLLDGLLISLGGGVYAVPWDGWGKEPLDQELTDCKVSQRPSPTWRLHTRDCGWVELLCIVYNLGSLRFNLLIAGSKAAYFSAHLQFQEAKRSRQLIALRSYYVILLAQGMSRDEIIVSIIKNVSNFLSANFQIPIYHAISGGHACDQRQLCSTPLTLWESAPFIIQH